MPKLTLEQRIYSGLNDAIEFEGTCFRIVAQRFANQRDVISTKGSKTVGGRFNSKGTFGVLYLSCGVHTCTEEATRATAVAEFRVGRSLPRTIVGIEVRLSRVLDLTNSRIRKAMGIFRKSDLIQTDWGQTQTIGRFAKEAGFEAILVPSAVWKGKNLDIFPDNLLPSSQVSVVNLERLQLPRVDVA